MDSYFTSYTLNTPPADPVAPPLNLCLINFIFPELEGIKVAITLTLNGGSDSRLVESSLGAIYLIGRREY